MKPHVIGPALMIAVALTACGRRHDQPQVATSEPTSEAAMKAAAEASQVSSIPGYSPDATHASSTSAR
jgi:hypothetical protein